VSNRPSNYFQGAIEVHMLIQFGSERRTYKFELYNSNSEQCQRLKQNCGNQHNFFI